MNQEYILAIDQGTTSTRAIAFDKKGNVKGLSRAKLNLIYPKTGWVECNAIELWNSVEEVITDLCNKLNMSLDEFDSIGITNQRETTIVWNKYTGEPIYRAIVWQSRQTSNICDKLENYRDLIHKKTGLFINPYFSASKIKFILDNVDGAREAANKNQLLFGTVDSWILYKLTNGRSHYTDITNASRTMLFNINTKTWDKELCDIFTIPMSMLPTVKPNTCDFGCARYFNSSTHIYAMAGDQQASLFGHTCFNKGDFKNTYGTGCFMLLNLGEEPQLSSNGLLTTIAWQINNKTFYALEGSVFFGGAIVEWLKNKMQTISTPHEADEQAELSEGGQVYVVPAFVGLGAPYWDNDVKATFFGITENTTSPDFIRGCLESIAFQCRDVFEVIYKDSNIKFTSMKVDGGVSRSDFLMQFQSDLIQVPLYVPKCEEVTALGISYMAGLQSGLFSSLDEIKDLNSVAKEFIPKIEESVMEEKYKKWKLAVEAARMFK